MLCQERLPPGPATTHVLPQDHQGRICDVAPVQGPPGLGLLEQKCPIINYLDAFFDAMAQLYNDLQRVITAETALHTLQQGWRPVDYYTVDFRKWSADTGWNEAALKYQYR